MNENKRLLQEIFAKLAVGDGSMFVEHLADDVIMRVTGSNSWSQTFRGKEALIRDLYGYLRSITTGVRKTIPIRFIADGGDVVIEARGEMTTQSGELYENEYCLVFSLENGKIVEMREYLDSIACERLLGKYPEITT